MRRHEPIRPNPDDLLRKLEDQDAQSARGRLRIFLGYAPRVGKSVRMFDEGCRRASRGQDVVIGAIQKGASVHTGNLEVVPFQAGGDALDVAAILRRAPQVCLIDELARDNPPGNPHAYRWEDVEQLISAGITVIGALNLQYVAEEQDAVERITGRRAQCSVPASFVHSADEIVIVDVPPEGLLNGGAAPKLDARQLSELREIALLLAAQVVEEQLLRYLKAHGIRQTAGTQERILVCITPRSNARSMIESGARVASRFHAHLTALHVQQGDLTRESQETVDDYLEYARKLGAEVQVIQSACDPIDTIVSYAREQRITQLFIGHTQRSPWSFWKPNPVDRLIKAAEGMDVRIFPQASSA